MEILHVNSGVRKCPGRFAIFDTYRDFWTWTTREFHIQNPSGEIRTDKEPDGVRFAVQFSFPQTAWIGNQQFRFDYTRLLRGY